MATVLALTSCPNDKVAGDLALALVTEKLAACVTRLPGARSIYAWQGAIEEADEVVCLIKTTQACVARLQARVVELHPYEVPELIVLDVATGLPPYLQWVATETKE